MTTALPPSILHTLLPISPATALDNLRTFLTLANDTAAFRPDSTLSTRGPISSSTSGQANLTLHHLNRIKLGLEGVRVGAAEIEAEDKEAEAHKEAERLERGVKRKRERDEDGGERKGNEREVRSQEVPVVNATQEGGEEEPVVGEAEVEAGGEWEEKDDYELAQDEENVVMNAERDPAAGLETALEAEDVMEIEETQPGEEVGSSEKLTAVDKEERKRLKKLKQKEEKQKAEGEGKARGKKDKKTIRS
jgi:hypothetical protein